MIGEEVLEGVVLLLQVSKWLFDSNLLDSFIIGFKPHVERHSYLFYAPVSCLL